MAVNNGTLNPAGATQQSLLQGIAPQTGSDQAQASILTPQLGPNGTIATETAQNVAYSNALAGIQSQQYGVQQQTTGLQLQEGVQQGAQNAAQQGIEEKGYGLQQGAIGIQAQELGNQQQQLNLNYNNALRSQQDSGAAQGSLYTHGQSSAIGTLGQSQALSSQALGLQNSLLNNQSQSEANTQQGEESGYAFTQQQLANAQANIGLIAKSNGLSNQQALTMLNYQNQQAGVQGQQQASSVAMQLAQLGTTDEQTIGQTLGLQAFAAGGSK